MKKLFFSVVCILSVVILSTCVLSCSKDDDGDKTTVLPPDPEEGKREPIKEKEIITQWVICEDPSITIIINSPNDKVKNEQEKVKNKLAGLFKKGDKYLFEEGDSCKITRGSTTVKNPNRYKIEGEHLVLDGYIKFLTNSRANDTLTLTANTDEVRGIVREQLKDNETYKAILETDILPMVEGRVRLVLYKEETEVDEEKKVDEADKTEK
ncbi:MAG: hypothetical protein LBS55_08990 [Prevotellaceae bacterium]|jgi:hypothetical protein|nr:hypothetical protein [Prevotellaceae bacterium]